MSTIWCREEISPWLKVKVALKESVMALPHVVLMLGCQPLIVFKVIFYQDKFVCQWNNSWDNAKQNEKNGYGCFKWKDNSRQMCTRFWLVGSPTVTIVCFARVHGPSLHGGGDQKDPRSIPEPLAGRCARNEDIPRVAHAEQTNEAHTPTRQASVRDATGWRLSLRRRRRGYAPPRLRPPAPGPRLQHRRRRPVLGAGYYSAAAARRWGGTITQFLS